MEEEEGMTKYKNTGEKERKSKEEGWRENLKVDERQEFNEARTEKRRG